MRGVFVSPKTSLRGPQPVSRAIRLIERPTAVSHRQVNVAPRRSQSSGDPYCFQ
jgi:hypothetical protein